MQKKVFILFLFCFTAHSLIAQTEDLMIQGTTPELYLQHAVAPKENWYSIGRLYNISPKEIAPLNGTTLDKPLSIGEQIKIPLTAGNFSQSENSGGEEVLIPVYHVVQEKEWMYRISTNYNKVPVETLEKWNHISKDQAKAGMKMIVGYLKVKKDQSVLAAKSTGDGKATASPVASSPPVATPLSAATMPPTITQPVQKTSEKVSVPVAENTEQQKQPVAVEEKRPAVPNKPVTQPAAENTAIGGYFKTMYDEQGKTANGAAGIFKSTSGWQDGKYYALMNNVSVGTIVKVSNPSTNKVVYAKVLGQLPDMKESVGLIIRLSDAAATELGSTVAKFPVEVKY